jgi:tRNA-Thr(GGU) m(6)t(6)A37 methyltransferase TsaA
MDKNSLENSIVYHPIGIIHSPFSHSRGTPVQAIGGADIKASVEIFPEYSEGLLDIDGFSHLILIYHLHLAKSFQLRVIPFLDTEDHGIFATRAPVRPNAIGISVVKLERVEGSRLHISETDILDGTPLLDIKPFIPAFDSRENVKTGWFTNDITKIINAKNDGRFNK